MSDKFGVSFIAVESEFHNCLCTCCHDTGKVIKIRIPTTLYYDGKQLSTKYSEYWLCRSCGDKMTDALKGEGRDDT